MKRSKTLTAWAVKPKQAERAAVKRRLMVQLGPEKIKR